MTRPYGWRQLLWRSEDFGPATKHAPKMRSRQRKTWRRLLHKQGRNDGRREIVTQLRDNLEYE